MLLVVQLTSPIIEGWASCMYIIVANGYSDLFYVLPENLQSSFFPNYPVQSLDLKPVNSKCGRRSRRSPDEGGCLRPHMTWGIRFPVNIEFSL